METQAKAELREFLTKTIADQIHLVAIVPDGQTTGRDFGRDVEAAATWAGARNAEGKNVYWTVNRARPGIDKKPAKADIIGVRFAHVDIDPPKDGSHWVASEAYQCLKEAEPQPSLVLWSGNGWQAFWRVEGASVPEIEAVNRSLIAKFGGDKGTHNADRLMRVPGLINYPNKKKVAAGRVRSRATIKLEDDGSVYSVAELIEAFGAEGEAEEPSRREHPQMSLGAIEYFNADDLRLEEGDRLRQLIEEPKGVDRSNDVFAVACEMGREGYSQDIIEGILLNPANAVSAHCLDQANPKRAARRAIRRALDEDDVARRRRQSKRTREIGDGSDEVTTTQIFKLSEMLERFVFIHDGSQVADRDRPQFRLSFPDFKNATAASKMSIVSGNGRPKPVPVAELWRGDQARLDAATVTFRAGASKMTTAPDGRSALNLWGRPMRCDTPPDWEDRARSFVDHIEWLFSENAGSFLDWLAHIEQCPGKLPHHGWLHLSKIHGKGRNWIASVLARLWRGNVASSFDLEAALNDGFNGRLSRVLLAIVDEIHLGGNGTYHHAQKLRQMVTADERAINPKYGRQHVEYNACRWLIFSNHIAALPLDDNDRRFWVVEHDGPVKDPEYYTRLYSMPDDPLFIASIGEALRRRDIKGFSPGALPPMTKAKKALIEATRSEADTTLAEIVQRWPCDVISLEEIKLLMANVAPVGAALRHALTRTGLVKLRKVRVRERPGEGASRPTPVYCIRNHGDWQGASPEVMRGELARLSWAEKLQVYDCDDDGAEPFGDCRDLI